MSENEDIWESRVKNKAYYKEFLIYVFGFNDNNKGLWLEFK